MPDSRGEAGEGSSSLANVNGVERAPTSALHLAWQDAASRRWFPIARLERRLVGFRFVYLAGFRTAAQAGLAPLPAFPDPSRAYESERLFPFFRNRVMNRARKDFEVWVARMGYAEADALTEDEVAFEVLARSRGRRSTDPFELFPSPQAKGEGGMVYDLEAFVHGVRHATDSAQAELLELETGAALSLVPEPSNPADPDAIQVCTDSGARVGYVPRYHCRDLHRLMEAGRELRSTLERVNPPPTPVQQRLLVRIRSDWPFEEGPLSDPVYRPLVEPR